MPRRGGYVTRFHISFVQKKIKKEFISITRFNAYTPAAIIKASVNYTVYKSSLKR